MAYTAEQKSTVARELARAGGNVAAAMRRLRDEYETFRGISDSTLRRMLRAPGFPELVAAEGETLHAARAAGIVEAERERARRDVEGSVVARLARDEAILDGLRQRVAAEIAKPDFDAAQATRLYAEMTRIHDRRREILIPALANGRDGAALVESVMEAAVGLIGQGKAKELIAKVTELYKVKLAAAEQQQEATLNV
jgi:hypothetical protein